MKLSERIIKGDEKADVNDYNDLAIYYLPSVEKLESKVEQLEKQNKELIDFIGFIMKGIDLYWLENNEKYINKQFLEQQLNKSWEEIINVKEI